LNGFVQPIWIHSAWVAFASLCSAVLVVLPWACFLKRILSCKNDVAQKSWRKVRLHVHQL
jgi:hypothetical protein